MRDAKTGDKFPVNRAVKWGAMTAGSSYLDDKWHDMTPSTEHTSQKWNHMEASTPRTSEKWVDICADESPNSDKWHAMKQEGRVDPYTMTPSEGDRTVGMKSMAKEKADNRVRRSTATDEFGSHREI